MNVRRLTTTSLACLGIAVGLLFTAPRAQADLPDVLSAAPKDTKIFVGTKSLNEVDKKWKQLLTAVEMDGVMPFAPSDIFGEMGVSLSSLDLTRSIGIALMGFDNDGDEPPFIMLLPVKNYAEWVANFGAGTSTTGVAEVTMPTGEPAYIRSTQGYAVLSPRKDLAEGYTAQENAAGQFKKRIGAVGMGVIERSQMFAIIDFAGLAEHKQEIVSGISEMVSQQVAQMGAMGMGMPMGEDVAKMNEALVGMIIDECSGIVAGVRYGDRGVAIDLAVQTRDGSEIGALMPGGDKPRNLLANFEDAPFMFAMSMDYGGVKVGSLIDLVKKRLGVETAEAGDQPNIMSSTAIWRDADGGATAIYPSPGGLFAGLLSRSITMLSGDSAKLTATLKDMMASMNGTEQTGIQTTTTYEAGAKQIGGINADTYSVKMILPPEMMQMQQAMSMIYGPAGLQGYLLPVKGGVLQTTSRNAEVVEKALAVINGEAPGMGANKGLIAVDQMLPPNPSMRFYIGLGAISQMVGPMAAMAVPGLDLEELGALPPMGIGASIIKGGIVGSFVIPAPVIKTIAEMVQQFAGGMGGEEGDEEPPLF